MSAGARSRKEEERRFLQWEPLTQGHIAALLRKTEEQVEAEFEEILGLRNQQSCMKEAALLDYYVCGFWWAKEAGLTPTQTSFTMAVLHLLLDNIREKQMGFVDNVMEFAKALAGAQHHSASRGDVVSLLDREQAAALTDYIKSSLFQKYRLYELLFTSTREKLLIGMERTIEVIAGENTFPPLEEGMPAELYYNYVASPPIPEHVEMEQEASGEPDENVDQQVERKVEDTEEEGKAGEYSIQEVKEVLAEVAKDMLGSLQAQFNEKLRLQEESYAARLDCRKNSSAK